MLHVGPPNVTLDPVSQELKENAPAVLTCHASSPLQVKITWYKNGKPIGRTGSQLKFDKFQYEDQGDYHCNFSTFLTSSSSKPALLVLKGLFLFSSPDPTSLASLRVLGTRKRWLWRYVIWLANFQTHLFIVPRPPPATRDGRSWSQLLVFWLTRQRHAAITWANFIT